eukprot:UN01954
MLATLLILLAVYLAESSKLYVGVKQNVNYDSAASGCGSVTLSGGQLATFGNNDDWNKIVAAARAVGGNSWIGLNDRNGEGKWKMIDGDTSYCDDCDSIPQWEAGEPNEYDHSHGEGEDCGEVYYSQATINDIPCRDSKPYICEFDSSSYVFADTSNYPQNPNNYYVLEFTSIKDMVIVVSLMLNVMLISCGCYLFASKKTKSYSKVKMYAAEDENIL